MPDYKSQGRAYAQQYGAPWDVFERLIQQESGWRQWDDRGLVLTSSAGALGLGQLMPATAHNLGVNPMDPLDNLKGAARYFADNLRAFGGDVVRAVAGYNMGPGAAGDWNRSRSWLHNYRNSRGQYPYRETEHYLDAILGPSWESIPAEPPAPGQDVPPAPGPPGRITIPIPGPDNDITVDLPAFPAIPPFPHIPSADEIGQGIRDAVWQPISAWWAALVAKAGDLKTALIVGAAAVVGINLIIFALLALAFRSPPAKLITKIGASAPNPYVSGASATAARFQ